MCWWYPLFSSSVPPPQHLFSWNSPQSILCLRPKLNIMFSTYFQWSVTDYLNTLNHHTNLPCNGPGIKFKTLRCHELISVDKPYKIKHLFSKDFIKRKSLKQKVWIKMMISKHMNNRLIYLLSYQQNCISKGQSGLNKAPASNEC